MNDDTIADVVLHKHFHHSQIL